MDATTLKVRAEMLAGASRAYGYQQPLSDAASRELEPANWCTCSHHTTEHHGPRGDRECSATGCDCKAFRRGGRP